MSAVQFRILVLVWLCVLSAAMFFRRVVVVHPVVIKMTMPNGTTINRGLPAADEKLSPKEVKAYQAEALRLGGELK